MLPSPLPMQYMRLKFSFATNPPPGFGLALAFVESVDVLLDDAQDLSNPANTNPCMMTCCLPGVGAQSNVISLSLPLSPSVSLPPDYVLCLV